MHPGLANGIVNGASWVGDVFTDRFQKAGQWTDYLLARFGGALSVNTILNRGDGWSAVDFQALYIACWTFYPLEKGSYMIPLTATQRVNVKSGYQTLGVRPTSHLHGHGRSAARGWSFLKGYEELLVQLEGGGKHSPEISPHLFLKAEGHTAASIGHLWSYIVKVRTGQGAVANAALERLAKAQGQMGLDLGIAERAAENYSNAYKVLLQAMELGGKTVSVHEAVSNMYIQCHRAMTQKPSLTPSLTSLVGKANLQPAMAANGVGGMDNADVAKMIEQVILPFGQAATGASFSAAGLPSFFVALNAAAGDLRQVATQLRADAARTGQDRTLRYFQEIVVAPAALDAGLDAAYQMLRADPQ